MLVFEKLQEKLKLLELCVQGKPEGIECPRKDYFKMDIHSLFKPQPWIFQKDSIYRAKNESVDKKKMLFKLLLFFEENKDDGIVKDNRFSNMLPLCSLMLLKMHGGHLHQRENIR